MAYFEVLFGRLPGGTEKTLEPGYRDSNHAPPERKPDALPPETTYTVVNSVALRLRACRHSSRKHERSAGETRKRGQQPCRQFRFKRVACATEITLLTKRTEIRLEPLWLSVALIRSHTRNHTERASHLASYTLLGQCIIQQAQY
jgi:hypothetical protein